MRKAAATAAEHRRKTLPAGRAAHRRAATGLLVAWLLLNCLPVQVSQAADGPKVVTRTGKLIGGAGDETEMDSGGSGTSGIGPLSALSLPLDDIAWRTDRNFRQALEGRISAVWRGVPGRLILQRLEQQHQVAIFLDGRIDPSRKHTFEISDRPLGEAIGQIADALGAAPAVLRNVVYLGPPEAAATLRTLVRLRAGELSALPSQEGKRRRLELAGRRTFRWDDLTRPRDLLKQMAAEWSLELEGEDQVPHDLWAAGAFPEVDASEALSCLLLTCGMTFEWTDSAAGIVIRPVPAEVQVEELHTPRGQSARQAAKEWPEKFPGITATVQGRKVLVRGTVEQQEAIADSLDPKTAARQRGRNSTSGATPLSRRRFTLRVERVPAEALFKRLKATAILIEYDAEQLEAAGIDFSQPVSMNVSDATAEEFFRQLCEPLKLTFEIDGLTVRLKPASSE